MEFRPRRLLRVLQLRQPLQFALLRVALGPEPDVPHGVGGQSAHLLLLVVQPLGDQGVGCHAPGQPQGQQGGPPRLHGRVDQQPLERPFEVRQCDPVPEPFQMGLEFARPAGQEVAVGKRRQLLEQLDQEGGAHGWVLAEG